MNNLTKVAIFLLPLAGCGNSTTEPTARPEPTMPDLIQQRQEINNRPANTMDEHIQRARDWWDNDAKIGIKKGYMTQKEYDDWKNQR